MIDIKKCQLLLVILFLRKKDEKMEEYLFGMFSAIIVIVAIERLCEGGEEKSC